MLRNIIEKQKVFKLINCTDEHFNNEFFCQIQIQYVTNYYFTLWEFSTSQKELLLVSDGSIRSLISGGDSGESWVLVRALGLL